MRPRRSLRRAPRLLMLLSALALVLAACGGGSGGASDASDASTTTTDLLSSGQDDPFVAQVASYELVADRPQRFMAALAGNGTGSVVSFGSVDLEFFFLGSKESPSAPKRRSAAPALFQPVAGQTVDPAATGPRQARPSEGLGVYVADPVTFDEPGFWGVRVKAEIAGEAVSANAAFEVVAEPRIPFPGQAAPRTDNAVAGAAGVDPVSIDSRAKDGAPFPDAALHTTTIAAALDAGKPLVVVVSTPVYCVSRFCGPITDSVANLAKTYEDRVAFVHLEVWKDFEKRVVNASAAQWISPKDGVGDTQEPWVFLVDRDGVIRQRFDNVVGDDALADAVRLLAA